MTPSSLRRFLKAWCVVSALIGSILLGAFSVSASFPVHVEATPNVTVSPCSAGQCVIFALSYANVSFGNGVNAGFIQVTTAGCILLDATGICVSKIPAAWPGATVNVTYWNPTASIGILAVMTVLAPVGATVNFTVTGATLGKSLLMTKNGGFLGLTPVSSTGNASFSWYVTSAADPIFQIAVFENIGGPGEPRPGVGLFIVPHFSVTRFFALFDASSDERVQFHDRSSIPSNISVSRLWNFGDNAFSQEKDPMHHYNFSFSATFDVTLAVCQNDVCNITTQPVAMMRWHVLLIGAILIGTTVIALVEIRRLGRKK